jgi:hypothetical protein
MKVTVKTLTNEQFSVEVADSATVLEAKTAIQASRGESYAASLQKLIHAGKVLKVRHEGILLGLSSVFIYLHVQTG